jgi:hypothetical protein
MKMVAGCGQLVPGQLAGASLAPPAAFSGRFLADGWKSHARSNWHGLGQSAGADGGDWLLLGGYCAGQRDYGGICPRVFL